MTSTTKTVSVWFVKYQWKETSSAFLKADGSVEIKLFGINKALKSCSTKQFNTVEEAEAYLTECRYKRVWRLKR